MTLALLEGGIILRLNAFKRNSYNLVATVAQPWYTVGAESRPNYQPYRPANAPTFTGLSYFSTFHCGLQGMFSQYYVVWSCSMFANILRRLPISIPDNVTVTGVVSGFSFMALSIRWTAVTRS